MWKKMGYRVLPKLVCEQSELNKWNEYFPLIVPSVCGTITQYGKEKLLRQKAKALKNTPVLVHFRLLKPHFSIS